MDINQVLAKEFKLKEKQVQTTIDLFDEGNTIPFIARYRKEATGELDEVILRELSARLDYLRNLTTRKEEVKRLIDEQGKLTLELTKQIQEALTLTTLEDIYRPFRPKRRTRASIARDKGLEPLARLLAQQPNELSLEEVCQGYINELVPTQEEAIQGALDILAEEYADEPALRQKVRAVFISQGILVSEASKEALEEAEKAEFRMYFAYQEPVKKIPPHRILAMNRGERDKALKVKLQVDSEVILSLMEKNLIHNPRSSVVPLLQETIKDSFHRLLSPSVERELRNQLTETAENHAITIFAKNLKSLILQAPVRNLTILGIDPAYRTGCKVVVINSFGDLLTYTTIYPHEPQGQWEKAKDTLKKLLTEHDVSLVTIGNGTASRETETLVAEILREQAGSKQVQYLIINEAGASVYSASEIARAEFPDLDVSIRGAVSIARRVMDPLAELVKIDPKSIGVGLYQHDVNQKELAKSLGEVVESCVNYVGVELNSASAPLLSYVAGLSSKVAKEIVLHRQSHGAFRKRSELKAVKGLGPKAFLQCAGFLRIADCENPLDNTAVHPESYDLATAILKKHQYSLADLSKKEEQKELQKLLKSLDPKEIAEELEAGEPTIRDILGSLAQPGRDPRDELPPPLFRSDVLTIEDLKPGMILKGTVQNVVDFGAFIDLGVKKAGLVHISAISDRYIKHPTEVLQVGDIVEVRVLTVETKTGRIGLSMKLE